MGDRIAQLVIERIAVLPVVEVEVSFTRFGYLMIVNSLWMKLKEDKVDLDPQELARNSRWEKKPLEY